MKTLFHASLLNPGKSAFVHVHNSPAFLDCLLRDTGESLVDCLFALDSVLYLEDKNLHFSIPDFITNYHKGNQDYLELCIQFICNGKTSPFIFTEPLFRLLGSMSGRGSGIPGFSVKCVSLRALIAQKIRTDPKDFFRSYYLKLREELRKNDDFLFDIQTGINTPGLIFCLPFTFD